MQLETAEQIVRHFDQLFRPNELPDPSSHTERMDEHWKAFNGSRQDGVKHGDNVRDILKDNWPRFPQVNSQYAGLLERWLDMWSDWDYAFDRMGR